MISVADIDLIVFDFDGVLTDNRVWVLQDGSEAVACNRGDGLAFDILRKKNIRAMILSTETNPVVTARAMKLKIPVLQGVSDKGSVLKEYCLQEDLDPQRILYVGNDLNDLPAFNIVGYPVAVADAHPMVLQKAKFVLSVKGGYGAARAVVRDLLQIESSYME